jgi:hypothetical protein
MSLLIYSRGDDQGDCGQAKRFMKIEIEIIEMKSCIHLACMWGRERREMTKLRGPSPFVVQRSGSINVCLCISRYSNDGFTSRSSFQGIYDKSTAR